jgi:hypothetical protein
VIAQRWLSKGEGAVAFDDPGQQEWRGPVKNPVAIAKKSQGPGLISRTLCSTHSRPPKFHALRPQLHQFGSQQHDPAVQFHCLVVDSNLAQALDGRDDPMLREILASSVEQLEKALCSACVAILSAKDAGETAGA